MKFNPTQSDSAAKASEVNLAVRDMARTLANLLNECASGLSQEIRAEKKHETAHGFGA